MELGTVLKIFKVGELVKFENHSEFNVFVGLIPVKPKRKMIDVMIIPKGNFLIDESGIDLTKIYVRMEPIYKPTEETDVGQDLQ